MHARFLIVSRRGYAVFFKSNHNCLNHLYQVELVFEITIKCFHLEAV